MDYLNTFDPREYWESRLKKDFDLEGVGFIGLGKAYNLWMYRVRKTVFLRLLRSLPVEWEFCNILDIGSGTGFYLDLWDEMSVKNISGTDITEVSIVELIKRYPNHEFRLLDIGDDNPGISPNIYDAVSAMDVLFHIVDDTRYLKALDNVSCFLKPGGYFIFTENFLHTEPIRKRHYVYRSIHEIEKMIVASGFEIVGRWPIFALMNFPVDSKGRFLKAVWVRFSRLLSKSNILGFLCGALLYPVERLVVRVLKESPTTEIMICRKKKGSKVHISGSKIPT